MIWHDTWPFGRDSEVARTLWNRINSMYTA